MSKAVITRAMKQGTVDGLAIYLISQIVYCLAINKQNDIFDTACIKANSQLFVSYCSADGEDFDRLSASTGIVLA
jgi:hypothetical protein